MTRNADIRLICLDLDGTALDCDGVHWWLADELVAVLNLAGKRGVRWCSNSGRNPQNQLGLLQACRTLENMPVAILAGERFIFWLEPHYHPHEPFNTVMQERMLRMHPRVLDALAGRRARLREQYAVNYEVDNDQVIGWNVSEEPQAPQLAEDLKALMAPVPEAQVLRNGTWVIVTHATAGKGVVLKEAAEHLEIPPRHILAIGDHMNDLDMLDGRVAAHVGCPGDANEEIKQAVRSAGGLVADLPHARGTAYIIRRILDLD